MNISKDCLFLVCDFLIADDIYNLANTCKKLKKTIKKYKYKKMLYDHYFNSENKLIYKYLKSFKCIYIDCMYLKEKYLKNVEILRLRTVINLKNLKNLRKLYISNYNKKLNITNLDFIQIYVTDGSDIQDLKVKKIKLRGCNINENNIIGNYDKLDLSCTFITGFFLKNTKIKSLDLTNCFYLNENNICGEFDVLNLSYSNITGTCLKNIKANHLILKCCVNLKEEYICGGYNILDISFNDFNISKLKASFNKLIF